MSNPFRHVSEVDTAGHENACVWCSAVMLAIACHDSTIPATRDEAYALRSDAGVAPGPATAQEALYGLHVRYGFSPDLILSDQTLVNRLNAGYLGLVTGSNGAFSAADPWRRWDPAFAGGHAEAMSATWRDDPLAPQSYAAGAVMLPVDLNRFIGGQGSAHLVALPLPEANPDMIYAQPGPVSTGLVIHAPYAAEPGGPTLAKTPLQPTRYVLAAYSSDGRYVALNGAFQEPTAPRYARMGWVLAADVTAIQPLVVTVPGKPPTVIGGTVAFSDGSSQALKPA